MATASATVSGSSPVKSIHKSNANSFPDAEARRRANKVHWLMEREMLTQWVGPMPVKEFFEAFMNVSASPKCPKVKEDFFKEVSLQSTEKGMYETFLQAMEKANFLPGYKLVDTSHKYDTLGDQQWRIDLTCYADDVDVRERPNQLDKAEWGIEFKPKDTKDPFGPNTKFIDEKDANQSSSRGQLTTYAAEWFNHQHRTHIFTIFISENIARFLYFDRSGAVVTERINYAEDATPIVQFMWYFSHLTAEQRGIDTTVTLATDAQAKEYRDRLEKFHARVATLEVKPSTINILKVKKKEHPKGLSPGDDLTDADWDGVWEISETAVNATLSKKDKSEILRLAAERMPCATRPVVLIEVPEGKEGRIVLGQGFASSAESVVGRATRAWPVWDQEEDKLYYLKDTWRSCLRGMTPEYETLEELNEKGINRIPRYVCGGCIANQKTRTAEFTGAPYEEGKRKPWVYGRVAITPRQHNRFLVDFIGRSIKHFSNSKQMLQAVYDAYNAHKDAWKTCGILHRDISVNNVMLDMWGRGVLNDWDLAKKENAVDTAPRTHARTGTWYFMSTLLLQVPGKKHTVQDDIEAFVLLVLYLGLSYLEHNYGDDLGQFMHRLFEESARVKGAFTGGYVKYATFTNNMSFIDAFEFEGNEPLTTWLETAFQAVSQWMLAYMNNSSNSSTKKKRNVQKKDVTTLDLYSHDFLSSVFEEALKSTDWPEGQDKFVNNFQIKLVDGMYRNLNASSTGSKRSYEELFGSNEEEAEAIQYRRGFGAIAGGQK